MKPLTDVIEQMEKAKGSVDFADSVEIPTETLTRWLQLLAEVSSETAKDQKDAQALRVLLRKTKKFTVISDERGLPTIVACVFDKEEQTAGDSLRKIRSRISEFTGAVE